MKFGNRTMRQPISRRQHGVADYLYVPAVAAAPELAGFTSPTAARLARAFSASALVSALCTRAEWGVVKVVPYRTHLAVDAVTGLAALAAPWLFGFADDARARNTFLAMGVVALSAVALSRPEEMPARGTPAKR